MNINKLWCTSHLLSELCMVTTWLDEDPNYERADAVKDLLKIIEFVNETFYGQAIMDLEEALEGRYEDTESINLVDEE